MILKIIAGVIAICIIIGVLSGLVVFDLLVLLVFVVCIWYLIVK